MIFILLFVSTHSGLQSSGGLPQGVQAQTTCTPGNSFFKTFASLYKSNTQPEKPASP
jgi:hypothetical protein